MTARIIAAVSAKGGVGKSTITVNVAASLALGTKRGSGRLKKYDLTTGGRRVLVVDMDRQQSAGDSLGVRGVPDESTYGMVLAGQPKDLSDCIYDVGFELTRGTLHVMPITPYDYELAVANLPNFPDNGLHIVSTVLQAVAEDYDYIVLDLRPELSHFSSAAMVAATSGLIVPVTSEVTTAVHLAEVQEHIPYLAESSGQPVRALGVARNRWDAKGEEGRLVDQLLAGGSMHVFDAIIPSHRVVSKAFAMSTGPVVTSFPKSPAAQRFHELTAEIVHLTDRGTDGQ